MPGELIDSIFSDPFAHATGLPFAYHAVGNEGWIVWSAGPDGRYEIDPATDYDPAERVPKASLTGKTYDPSNGSESRGDIWRTKNE